MNQVQTNSSSSFGDALRAALDSGSAPEHQEADAAPEARTSEPVRQADVQAADEGQETHVETIEAPSHWSETDRTAFGSLPPEAQRILLERDKNLQAGFTQKTEALAQQRRAYQPIEGLADEYARRSGLPREQVLPQVVNFLRGLATTYQQIQANPVDGIAQLAESLKITDKLSERLTGYQYEDEATRQMRIRQQELERENQRLRASSQSAQEAEAVQEITRFKDATDEAGNPRHPHFDDLRMTMHRLMSANESLTLDKAYEAALRLDKPEIIEAQIAERIRREESERRARDASKARKNARTTNGKARGPSDEAKPEKLSRRDTLAALWDEQVQRED